MKKTKVIRINKILSAILSFVLIFSSIPVFEYNALAEETIYPTGDIDFDNNINASDALEVLKCVTKMTNFDDQQLIYGDLTMDGKIDAIDALIILRHAARISYIPFDAKPEVPDVKAPNVSVYIEESYDYADEYCIYLHSYDFDPSAYELNLFYENIDLISYDFSDDLKLDFNTYSSMYVCNNVEDESYVSFAGVALADNLYEGNVAEIVVKASDVDSDFKLVDGLSGDTIVSFKISDFIVATPEPSEEPTPTVSPTSSPNTITQTASIEYDNGTAVITINTEAFNSYAIGVRTDAMCTNVEYDRDFLALKLNGNYILSTASTSSATDSVGNMYATISGAGCVASDGSDIPYEGPMARFTYEDVKEGTEFVIVYDVWSYTDVNDAPILATLKAESYSESTTPEPSEEPTPSVTSVPIINLNDEVKINSDSYYSSGMYKFIPKENGTYKFYSTIENTGYNNIVAKLYDSNLNEINYSSFITNMGFDFAIEAELIAGETYYIDANTYLGDYILSLEKLPEIERIEISALPFRMEYMKGYSNYDLSGLQLRATLKDGSVEYWNYYYGDECLAGYNVLVGILTDETDSLKGFQINCAGQVIEESYTVLENNVESISVDTAPTRVYYMGDENYGYITDEGYELSPTDLSGLVFNVNYKDGTSEVLTSDTLNYEYLDFVSYDSISQPGEYEVTFSYLKSTDTYKIKLVESNVASIEVIKEPNNTKFYNGYLPDFIGMQIEISYNDGTSEIVEVSKDNVSYAAEKGYEYVSKVSFDEKEIIISKMYDEDCYTIKYLGSYCEYNGVKFSESKVISSIDVKNVSLVPDNISFAITYQDGSTEVLNAISFYNNAIAGVSAVNAYILTEKGVLDCYIKESFDNDAETTIYTVIVFGLEIDVISDTEIFDLGDVDGNGKIDASDALAILKHAAKISTLNDEQLLKSEVTEDSSIDAGDALMILKYAARLIDSF